WGDPLDAGQDRTTLLGSILRLDVDDPAPGLNYGIPPDNPFVGNDQGWREEIWAYGLRNPWRFSIDAATGDVWVGDVGQNTWEEVSRITAPGANLGWDVKEGAACYDDPDGPDPDEPPCTDPDLLDPVWAYHHNGSGASVTGGYVYRGTAIPALTGAYLVAGFMTGRVWRLDEDGAGGYVAEQILEVPTVTTFGVDEEGELYLATRAGGRIYRFMPDPLSTEPAVPAVASLRLTGPNPVQERTTVVVEVAEPGPVRVALYDALGREVAVVLEASLAAGAPREVGLDATGLAAGTYFLQLDAAGRTAVRALTVVR
ncbi:MAG: PQQ-dependent sugar dehydrogenase, partial [Rhodothermales bacterium]|nr:PQQ-dependent sugar dehydrogenase [Rhodothermales bacterium]